MSEGRPQQGAVWKARLQTGGADRGHWTESRQGHVPPKKSLVVRIKGKI